MTLEDIARKLDTIDTSLSTLERKVEDGFSASEKKSLLSSLANIEAKVGTVESKVGTLESKFGTLESKFGTLESKFGTLESKFDTLESKFDTLESKLDDGFRASQIRDEELHRLTRFGLEADEVMSDSIARRLDQSNQKQDEQISLLKDVFRQTLTRP